MFFAFLCLTLQLKAHELVAPGFNDDFPKDVDDFGIFRLHELFSESTGIVHELPDKALSATYSHDNNFLPNLARIDYTEVSGNGRSWAGLKGKVNVLTVDMKTSHIVMGVATQGRADSNQYVTSYSVEVSESGTKWEALGDFVGNFDNLSVTRVRFEKPVLARFVKFTVLKHYSYPSMRVDVLVYKPNED